MTGGCCGARAAPSPRPPPPEGKGSFGFANAAPKPENRPDFRLLPPPLGGGAGGGVSRVRLRRRPLALHSAPHPSFRPTPRPVGRGGAEKPGGRSIDAAGSGVRPAPVGGRVSPLAPLGRNDGRGCASVEMTARGYASVEMTDWAGGAPGAASPLSQRNPQGRSGDRGRPARPLLAALGPGPPLRSVRSGEGAAAGPESPLPGSGCGCKNSLIFC